VFDDQVLLARFDVVCLRWALWLLVDVLKRVTQDEILEAWDHPHPEAES
jgi:hypothetical protein